MLEISERSEHTITTTRDGGQSSVKPIERTVVFEVAAAWNGVTQARVSVLAEMSDCVFPFRSAAATCLRPPSPERQGRDDHLHTDDGQKDAGAVLGALGSPSYRPGRLSAPPPRRGAAGQSSGGEGSTFRLNMMNA